MLHPNRSDLRFQIRDRSYLGLGQEDSVVGTESGWQPTGRRRGWLAPGRRRRAGVCVGGAGYGRRQAG